jgi:hypothetical protein
MSGRASAALDINIPAPRVAASATAILNDIDLSTLLSSCSWGPSTNSCATPAQRPFAAGLAFVFLTVRVNRQAATLALGLNLVGGKRGNVRKKVNDLETTLVRKQTAGSD